MIQPGNLWRYLQNSGRQLGITGLNPHPSIHAKVVTAANDRRQTSPHQRHRRHHALTSRLLAGMAALHNFIGALGGTRTPTMLLTATSRQRVYQFRHERLGDRHGTCAGSDQDRINGADVTNQEWRDKAC
jgi:hypothetical protein